MNHDLLSELQAASRRQPATAERELIAAGPTTYFSGVPAHAPEGTIALANGDAKIIIRESDIRAIEKQGDEYRVGVSADAHVLLRVDKLLKATPTDVRADDCRCGEQTQDGTQTIAKEKKPVNIEIESITVCRHICGYVNLWGINVYVCVNVDCYVIKP
jgi:hypothetical protein